MTSGSMAALGNGTQSQSAVSSAQAMAAAALVPPSSFTESKASQVTPTEFLEFVVAHPALRDEFCYIKQDGPYEFSVVPFSMVDPRNYMTLSVRGVTTVQDGRVEFVDLQRWQNSHALYRELAKIPFFRRFRAWKAIATWRVRVTGVKKNKCARVLNSRLFALDRSLCTSLLRVRAECAALETVRCIGGLDDEQSYTLREFLDLQAARREEVARHLDEVWHRLRDELRATCLASLEEFLAANGFGNRKEGGAAAEGAAVVSYTERATSRSHCRKLVKFVRTAQYLLSASISRMLIYSVEELLTVMSIPFTGANAASGAADGTANTHAVPGAEGAVPVPEAKEAASGRLAPMLQVECVLDQNTGGLKCVPAGATVRAALEGAVLDAVAVLSSSVKPFVTDRAFAAFTAPLLASGDGGAGAGGSGLSDGAGAGGSAGGASGQSQSRGAGQLLQQVTESGEFRSLMLQVGARFDAPFQEVLAYAKRYQALVDRHLENEEIQHPEDAFGDCGLDELSDLIASYRSQTESINGLQTLMDVGVFRLDTRGLRSLLLPSPQRLLQMLCEYVPRTCTQKCVTATNRLQSYTERMSATLATADDFVWYSNFLTEAAGELPSLIAAVNEVERLVEIIKENHIRLDAQQRSLLGAMHSEMTNFKTQLQYGQDSAEANVARFSAELEGNIPKLEQQVRATFGALQEPGFFDDISMMKEEEAEAAVVDADADGEGSSAAGDAAVTGEGSTAPQLLTGEGAAANTTGEGEGAAATTAAPQQTAKGRAQVLARIAQLEEEVDAAASDGDRFNRYQETLGIDVTPFEFIDELKQQFNAIARLWRGLDKYIRDVATWQRAPFKEVDVDAVNKEVALHSKTIMQTGKALPDNPVVEGWGEMVQSFKNTLPVVQALRNPALGERHWEDIVGLIGTELDTGSDDFTLQSLVDLHVEQHKDALLEIAAKATAERALEEMLQKIKDVWAETDLTLAPYKDSKELFILAGVDDVITTLEDSLVNVSTIAGSRYVGPIREEVDGWQKDLVLFQETLDEWLAVQRSWIYLNPIFDSADIKKQLPAESAVFQDVDGHWRGLMKETNDYAAALPCCTREGRLALLRACNDKLNDVQKALEEYLLSKCLSFPRFFFLSTDELLEIVSQARRVEAVQPHLIKCFDALVRLGFAGEDSKSKADDGAAKGKSGDIVKFFSSEGEAVPLVKPLKARGNVEKWLGDVEHEMVRAIHDVIRRGWRDYRLELRPQWVARQYAQVCACVAAIFWTFEAEEILVDEARDKVVGMREYHKKNVDQLEELTILVRSNLTPVQRRSVVALVTQDVHNRDIVEQLCEEKVTDISNFSWQQQLRYYWETTSDSCVVRQVEAVLSYSYEYQGATTRLVITPLTDRCWMTITSALAIYLGSAPAGPAGTGKTESTKDLAKALAIQCVVFNCSDQIDVQMMAKLFSGVISAGAWTCLDEFNRISVEVLSVVAQQVLNMRIALQQQLSEFVFEGRKLQIKPTCGVFITMNPGYAGRTELPDNLKVLFRPVSMMVPSYTLIAEVMLFAEGFSGAKVLSGKFTKLYQLSSEQLSKQPHYDFGMRAVKSVLVMAGALKRKDQNMDENVLLIRAMRDSNVPKFLSDDLPLFAAITADLFPGVDVPFIDYGELKGAVQTALETDGYTPHPYLVDKCIQLYETFQVRFGVTLVGPCMGGKTVNYRSLARALGQLRESIDAAHPAAEPGTAGDASFQRVTYNALNPKAILMGELYGEVNQLTQEWTDGLASTLMRASVSDTSKDLKWTVFDGPVDALWIENMNTVLDDNMLLCLSNGERIKLNWTMRMLFEVEDLKVASPATVSRLGMVYVTAADLGWRPYFLSWLKRMPENPFTPAIKEQLEALAETYFDRALKVVRKSCVEPVKTVDQQLVASVCRLLEAMTNDSAKTPFGCASRSQEEPLEDGTVPIGKPIKCKDMEPRQFQTLLVPLFAFCFVWGVGGALDSATRGVFAREAEQWFDQVAWPRGGSVFDGYLDFAESKPALKRWDQLVSPFVFDPNKSYFELLVSSADSVAFSYVLDRLISSEVPAFLTGSTGVGKSVELQNLLALMQEHADVVPVSTALSAQTKSAPTQYMIEGRLEKKRKTLLGAPAGKLVALLVDDVNMPQVEEYGAQPPVELLRLLVDHGGFYDRKKLTWKDVEGTVLMLCAGPPGGGRNDMTKRFSRHFHVLCQPDVSEETMGLIFGSILTSFLQKNRFKQEVELLGKQLVSATVELYDKCGSELLPTPLRSHYTFNLRDVSKVVQGLLQVRPAAVPTAEHVARLWVHEVQRIFEDRLINAEDKSWLRNILAEFVKSKFRVDLNIDSAEDLGGVMWGSYYRPGVETAVYEEAPSLEKVQKLLEDYLDDYNVTHPSQMTLVFFADCAGHANRVARVLAQPRGNMLLAGVGGSGRSSCARLCTSLREMKLCEIVLAKGYGIDAFREDVKGFLMSAGGFGDDDRGVRGVPTVFMLGDTQIIDETFLEDVNNVLNAGEVPNLFASDEVDRIVAEVRTVAKEQGRSEAKDAVYALFIERVRNNLHVLLTMSPVGPSLRVRLRRFPSLVNCSVIDWYLPWPADALISVASRFLQGMGGGDTAEEVRMGLARSACELHTTVLKAADDFLDKLRRHVYATPKSYIDLVGLYLTMLEEKREEKGVTQRRLRVGVEKIASANDVVASLQEELTQMTPVIQAKMKEADQLIPVVKEEQKKAAVVKERVSVEEASVRKTADEVSLVKEDAQRDLDVALPALKAAVKSLDSLDKKDIQEIKSFAKPPPLVVLTLEAVCILLGEKPDWDTAKRVLGDGKFMDRLKEYDKDNIPTSALNKLAKYVDKSEYQPDVVGKQSKAAKSLCQWTHAMDTYSKVAKEVEPKKQRLAEMGAQLEAAMTDLKEKQDQLQAVLDQVAGLEKKLNDTIEEKDRLVHEAELTRQRLQRADILTVGLKSEGVRWKETVLQIGEEIENLTGDVFLSAAAISYYGPFSGDYRKDIVDKWVAAVAANKIPCGEHFELQKVMGDVVEIRQWTLQGLPTDSVSVANGVMVTRGTRWPLMIDPQAQANNWVKKKEGKGMKVIKMTNPRMLLFLENSIRTGSSLLFEDMTESLDPALEPVLQKAVVESGGRRQIKVGDSNVDYDDNFKLYMTTKLPNPHYYPEVCIKVTIVNFTVTASALREQLLNATVLKERPEMVERRTGLQLQLAEDKKTLAELESEILRLLSESQGNILDDQELISTLQRSKEISKEVNVRVAEAETTAGEIEVACAKYESVAELGSILYFVIADLANINSMYAFSLSYFVNLFNRCIDSSIPASDLSTRLTNIMEYTKTNIFRNVSRGLFEDSKMIFSFLIASSIDRNRGAVTARQWSLLLRGVSLDIDLSGRPPVPEGGDLCSEKQWDLVYAIEQVDPDMAGLTENINKFSNYWGDWTCVDAPHTEELPENWESVVAERRMARLQAAWEERKSAWDAAEAKRVEALEASGKEDDDEDDDEEDEDEDDDEAEAAARKTRAARAALRVPAPFAEPPISAKDGAFHYFTKLLLLRALCPEKVVYAVQEYVRQYLGESFVVTPAPTMRDVYADTACDVPVVFVLSTGADPTSMLFRFCKEREKFESLRAISLGQGQGPKAQKMMEAAMADGGWVLLQNCHLAKSWMPSLAKLVEGLQDNPKVHEEFRLFLTSMPADYFPTPVLQASAKLTTEPPRGLRSNLMGSFVGVTDDYLDDCAKPVEWRRLVFALKTFHAVTQERRKFGALGFNVRYEFNTSDLETSETMVRNMLNKGGADTAVPFDTLQFVIGQINYGGRVTDDNDRRCLMCMLERFVTGELLEPDFCFSESGTYRCPDEIEEATADEIRAFVEGLPLTEEPEVFGLHANAEIAFQRKESDNILSSVLAIQPRESGGGDDVRSPEETCLDMCADMLAHLPPLLTMDGAHASTFAMDEASGLMNSLGTCLSQEMARFNTLGSALRSSLQSVQQAIRGLVVMTGDLDGMFGNMVNNEVPKLWDSVTYPSLRPLSSWFEDYVARVNFLQLWVASGPPDAYWLSSLFFPQGFLTSVLQGHSRLHRVAVDVLGFEFQAMNAVGPEEIVEPPEEGIHVFGFFFDGASWNFDEMCVDEAELGVMNSPAPVITFVPRENVATDPLQYSCPLYKTSVRAGTLSTTGHSTNFVLAIALDSLESPSYWVLQGAALLTMLDD